MASLYKRNGNYYGQWFDANRRPRQKRHSLRTGSKRTAQQLLLKADDAYRLGRWDPWVDPVSLLDDRPREPVTLGAAVRAYLQAKERSLRPPTYGTYRSVLQRFRKRCGAGTVLVRVSSADVDSFIGSGGVAASTQRLRLRVVRAFCNWAMREGLIDESPIERVVPPPVPARVPRAASPADVEAICEAVREDYQRRLGAASARVRVRQGDLVWLVPLFQFAQYTGLRASELARLRWGHIDMERGLIVIEHQKSGRAGTVPCTAMSIEILEGVGRRGADDYVFTSPQGRQTRERSTKAFVNLISARFTRYRKAAGIVRPLTLHSLRHGFATELARHGKSAWVIQAACRHSSITVSQAYVSLANEHLKAELDDVFGPSR